MPVTVLAMFPFPIFILVARSIPSHDHTFVDRGRVDTCLPSFMPSVSAISSRTTTSTSHDSGRDGADEGGRRWEGNRLEGVRMAGDGKKIRVRREITIH